MKKPFTLLSVGFYYESEEIIAVTFQIYAIGKKKSEKIWASTGFEPVTSAIPVRMLYQLSYEATHWERGQFLLIYYFISPYVYL